MESGSGPSLGQHLEGRMGLKAPLQGMVIRLCQGIEFHAGPELRPALISKRHRWAEK